MQATLYAMRVLTTEHDQCCTSTYTSTTADGSMSSCLAVHTPIMLLLLLPLFGALQHYCMPRFEAHCAHPDNIGCSSRCALYIIINYHCVTDAYDPVTRTFNASCKYCNVCWDRSGSNTVGARKAPYALLQARGASGALFVNHWLVSWHA